MFTLNILSSFLDLFLALNYGTQHFQDHCRTVCVMNNIYAVSVIYQVSRCWFVTYFKHHTVLLRRQMKDSVLTVSFSKLPFYLSLYMSLPSIQRRFLIGVYAILVSYYHCKHYFFFQLACWENVTMFDSFEFSSDFAWCLKPEWTYTLTVGMLIEVLLHSTEQHCYKTNSVFARKRRMN